MVNWLSQLIQTLCGNNSQSLASKLLMTGQLSRNANYLVGELTGEIQLIKIGVKPQEKETTNLRTDFHTATIV